MKLITAAVATLLAAAHPALASQQVSVSSCNESKTPVGTGCDSFVSPLESFIVGTNSLYIESNGTLRGNGKVDPTDPTISEIAGSFCTAGSCSCRSVFDADTSLAYLTCQLTGGNYVSGVFDVKLVGN